MCMFLYVRVQLSCCSSGTTRVVCLFVLRQRLSLERNSPSDISWLASEAPGSTCLCLPDTGLTHTTTTHSFVYMGSSGFEHRSSAKQVLNQHSHCLSRGFSSSDGSWRGNLQIKQLSIINTQKGKMCSQASALSLFESHPPAAWIMLTKPSLSLFTL